RPEDFVDSDDEEEARARDDASAPPDRARAPTAAALALPLPAPPPPSIASLPPDASSRILSHLLPHELFRFALASRGCRAAFRSEALWRTKFLERWNCLPDPVPRVVRSPEQGEGVRSSSPSGGRDDGFWRGCYAAAHRNPHDLWVRHWNCVWPEDVAACAGRTAVPDAARVEGRGEGGRMGNRRGDDDDDDDDDGDAAAAAAAAAQNGDGKYDNGNDDAAAAATATATATATSAATAAATVDGDGAGDEGNDDEGRDRDLDDDDARDELARLRRDFDAPSLRLCPACRHHPMLRPLGLGDDVAEAADAELTFSRRRRRRREGRGEEDEGGTGRAVGGGTNGDVDPTERAEVAAAAHALLANSSDVDARRGRRRLRGSPARAIYYATRYSVAKWCRNLNADGSRGNGCGGGVGGGISEPPGKTLLEDHRDQLSDHTHSMRAKERRSVRRRAQFAFECAATHGRRVRTKQYESSGVNFLADALFFNVGPSTGEGGRRSDARGLRDKLVGGGGGGGGDSGRRDGGVSGEGSSGGNGSGARATSSALDAHPRPRSAADELRRDADHRAPDLGPRFETTHHTWHVIRLTNPGFVSPIAFRCYVQSDHFAVYPSEGYLKPGETTHVVLGVRTSGGIANEAFERFDVERRGSDGGGDDDDGEEEEERPPHPPLVGFAIRYLFAPPVPCSGRRHVVRPDDGSDGFGRRRRSSFFAPPAPPPSEAIKLPSVIDRLWDAVGSEAEVRSLFLSAHVHSNYAFDEFQNDTLTPFEVAVRSKNSRPAAAPPLTAVLPELRRRSPELHSLLQNLDAETEDSVSGDALRTERGCASCGRDWGAQAELLGRAYLLRRLECHRKALVRDRRRRDFERTLGAVPSLLRGCLGGDDGGMMPTRANRLRQLIFCLHTDYLLQKRADRLVAPRERRLYASYETYLDETLADLQKCLPRTSDDDRPPPPFGVDPERRRPWRTKGVAHRNAVAPGGRQDDPNHEEDGPGSPGRTTRPSMHTDMFQDDALKGLACALSMIVNPKDLVGHGVFDRVRGPGTLVRCPSRPVRAFFRPSGSGRDPIHPRGLIDDALALLRQSAAVAERNNSQIGRRARQRSYFKRINFEMNEQDPDGLGLVALGRGFPVNFQTSLAHYLSNVPMPGQGPLLLSSPNRGAPDFDGSVLTLYTRVQSYSHIISPDWVEGGGRSDEQRTEVDQPSENQQERQDPNNGVEQVFNLDLNIVWLIARHLGWVVDDEDNRGSLLVDRRLLIASQWLSNSIMVISLLLSLLSRRFLFVTPYPVEFQVGFWKKAYVSLPLLSSVQGGMSRSQMMW
ncbi:hypothetical protein ACHAWF_018403, partial [Thalassiosira exigua]